MVPDGVVVAVVGAVGSVGLPEDAGGGVAGIVCCAIAPLANIPQIVSAASRIE